MINISVRYGLLASLKEIRVNRAESYVVDGDRAAINWVYEFIDLEGRPIAGATVRATTIWYSEKGELPAWVARARNGAEGNLWQALQQLPLPRTTSPHFFFFRVGERQNPQRQYLVDFSGIKQVARAFIGDPGIVVQDDRR